MQPSDLLHHSRNGYAFALARLDDLCIFFRALYSTNNCGTIELFSVAMHCWYIHASSATNDRERRSVLYVAWNSV